MARKMSNAGKANKQSAIQSEVTDCHMNDRLVPVMNVHGGQLARPEEALFAAPKLISVKKTLG